MGPVKCQLNMYFLNASYNSQRQVLNYLKQVLLQTCLSFINASQKRRMVEKDSCTVALVIIEYRQFLILMWERRKEILYSKGSASKLKVSQSDPTVKRKNCYGG